MIGKKKPPTRKEQDSAQALLEALKEVETQHKKKVRDASRKSRFAWLAQVPGRVRVLITLIAVVFLVLVGDGLRREGQEFGAVLYAFTGSVLVKDSSGKSVLPKKGQQLRDRELVITGRNSSATLTFTDGSAIQVQPDTQFEVRLLDYARGGTRDRSFMVRYGSVVAHVSQFFGQKSRATICTPTTVAAVRGTGFQVFFDPQSKRSLVAVTEGRVSFRTPTGTTADLSQGALGSASGYRPDAVQALQPASGNRIGGQVQQLTQQFERPPTFLEKLEMSLNNALDPVLQIAGLAPGGWSYQAVSFARLAAAKKVMNDLARHIESAGGEEAPNFLNPVTLEELRLPTQEQQRILDAFSGGMLESYQKTGANAYIIRARARDKKRTLLELAPNGLREVPE